MTSVSYLYPAPEAREHIMHELNAKGAFCATTRETLRRKDGTLLYTLQNITGRTRR